MGIGYWGLGIGDWAQSPIPNPQSPIPNPQSPLIYSLNKFNSYLKRFLLYNIFYFLLFLGMVFQKKIIINKR